MISDPMAKNKKLSSMLRLLVYLNVLDTILTLTVISLKWATEANPIMEYVLQQGPMVFGGVKMALSVGGCLLLWKAKSSKWTPRVAVALCLCYVAVILYEFGMIVATVLGN